MRPALPDRRRRSAQCARCRQRGAGARGEGASYYYRALATNADGTAYGAQRSFTSLAAPALTPPPAEAPPTSTKPKTCPKGKVRKAGRCVKKAKKHGGKHRTATRIRGGSK